MAAAEADTVENVINTEETETEVETPIHVEIKVKNTSGFVDNWQHERTLLESLRYSLKENILCDVTFIVGEDRTRIQAHKLILSLRSCVFQAMLTGDLKEQDDIVIPDTEAETFHLFLEFLYTDETDFKADNVIRLLYLARKYDVIHLEKRCLNYLETQMKTNNVCVLLEESHIYKQDSFMKTCLKYIRENSEAVLNSESFTDLCRECFRKIIESNYLNATEEIVFQSCMKWSEAECRRQEKEIKGENQREMLGKELYFIRFPLLEREYFEEKILPTDLLSESEGFKIMRSYVYPEKDVSPFSKSCRYFRRRSIKMDLCQNNLGSHRWSYDVLTFCVDRNTAVKGFSILGVVENNLPVTISASVCELSTDVIVPGSSVEKKINKSILYIDFPITLEIKKDSQYNLIARAQGRVSCMDADRQSEIREAFLKCTLSGYKRCRHTDGIYGGKIKFISRLKFLV